MDKIEKKTHGDCEADMRSIKIKLIIYSLSFLFLLILTKSIHSQSSMLMSVSGFIKDVNTNEPLADIEIRIVKLQKGKVTTFFDGKSDKNGYYRIGYLEPGEYYFNPHIPEIGEISIFYDPTARQEEQNVLHIKEGRNVILNFFIGEDDEEYESMNKNCDGTVLNYTIIYADLNKIWLQKLERKEEVKLQMITHNGLTIVLDDPEYLDEGVPLPGNPSPDKAGVCSYKLGGGNSRQFMPFCDRRPPNDRKRCSYEYTPEAKIIFKIRTFSKTRIKNHYKKKYPTCIIEDSFVQCQFECLQIHEETHQELGVEIVKRLWDELWINYKKTCCSSSKTCYTKCIKLFEEFKEKFTKEYEGTEDKAVENQKKCIKDKGCPVSNLICN